MITDYHRGPTRALATGINLTGMVCGSIVGSSCGWLADRYSWNFAYLAIGLPSVALALVAYFFLRDAPRERATSLAAELEDVIGGSAEIPVVRFAAAVRSLARPGPLYYMIGCMAVQGAVSWIIIGWMPTVMREQYHLGQGAAGVSALGILYVSQTTGLLLGGAWSDRWSRTNARARILLPAFAIMLAAPIFWLTGWSHLIFFTLASLSAYGLSMGFLGCNQMAIVCLVVDPRYRATAMGVLNGGTAIVGGLAVYGVGALRDAGVSVGSILAFAGVGVLLCGVLLWLVHLTLRDPEGRATT